MAHERAFPRAAGCCNTRITLWLATSSIEVLATPERAGRDSRRAGGRHRDLFAFLLHGGEYASL